MKTMTTNVMKKFLKKLPKDIENIIKDDIKDLTCKKCRRFTKCKDDKLARNHCRYQYYQILCGYDAVKEIHGRCFLRMNAQ